MKFRKAFVLIAVLSVNWPAWLPATAGSADLARAEIPGPEAPMRLVMVEERGCRYCLAWDREVGRSYGVSAEGRLAPLVRVGRSAPVLASLKPVVYTPTFILIDGGDEVGRITGYPGAAYFWEELAALIAAPARGATRER